MNPRKCVQAVRAATGDAFTESEIDDYLDRLAQKARRAKREAPTIEDQAAIRQAAAELTREEIMESMIKRRLALADEIKTAQRRARLDALPERLSAPKKLTAYDLGMEIQGFGTGSSTDAEGRARSIELRGGLKLWIDQMPGLHDRLSNFFFEAEKGVDLAVRREVARLNGDASIEPTQDEGVVHAARGIADALEKSRQMQNAEGAWIQKLEGYTGRQKWDAEKVAGGFFRELAEIGRGVGKSGVKALDWEAAETASARRAFREFRDDMKGWLGDETFDGLEPQDLSWDRALKADTEDELGDALRDRRRAEEAQLLASRGVIDDPKDPRELMLFHVWLDIVTGRHEMLSGADDHADFRLPASRAKAVSKARVLHFRTPEDGHAAAIKYGSGSYFSNIMDQLDRGGLNAGLMSRWGPNPDAARAAEIGRLSQEAGKNGNPAEIKRLNSRQLQTEFEVVSGRAGAPANVRLAKIGRSIRAWEGLTKLGSIVLSKTTDAFLCGNQMARVGGGFLRGYEGYFTGLRDAVTAGKLSNKQAKEAADALFVGVRGFAGHLGGGFTSADGLTGWMAWASRMQYRLNGFEHMNEAVQHGWAQVFARVLGQEAERPFEQLHKGTQETFERFGITPEDWNRVRRGIQPASDGRTYFTLDHLDDIPEHLLSPEDRAALKLKFLTMFHDQVENVTAEPRAREKISKLGGTGGTQAGTFWGEIARCFSQFRGFTTAIVGRHLVPAARGFAGYSPAALLLHMMAATTAAGYAAMNLKLISRGEAPVSPFDQNGMPNLEVWTAALAQGGGLGIYGDFMFGEKNRNGQDVLGTLVGPAAGDLAAAAQVVTQAINGGAINEKTGRSLIPGELTRIASRNVPVINTWYTRLALDYLFFWRLAEWSSPGYLQRYQSRVENEEGHAFIVPPTAAR